MKTFDEVLGELKRGNGECLESALAVKITNLHWVGPLAYLHVIYRPASPSMIMQVGQAMQFPVSLQHFYECCNGLSLYSGTIRMFGCVQAGTLLDRSDPLYLPPLDIIKMNQQFVSPRSSHHMLCIGVYSYDRSLVCIDRQSERVTCYRGEDLRHQRGSWSTIENWLSSECSRLSSQFSPDGRRLGDERFGLPGEDVPYPT